MNIIAGTAMEHSKLNHARHGSKGWQKDNIACVYPQLLVGAGCQLTPAYALRARITHVINCAFPEDSPRWFKQVNPDRIVTLGAIDSANVNILDWYPAFEHAVSTFLRDPECVNIYIHCQCGINRSAYLALAYVIDHFDIPMDAAALNLVIQRPCALSNPAFWTQLQTFAKSRASNKYGSAPK
jgi:predicted protein tyrosine phosphatase